MFPDSGMQQYFCRSRFATFLFLQGGGPQQTYLLPPESELQQNDLWQESGIQQRDRFPESGLQLSICICVYIYPDSELQQNTFPSRVRIMTIRKWKVAVIYQCRRQDVPGFRNAKVFLQIQVCNIFFIPPRGGLQQSYLLPPESGLQQNDLWQDSGIQQRDSFPESGLQLSMCIYGGISPDSELQQNTFPSRVRIVIIRIFGQIQESSKGFVFQIRDCHKSINPPESGLQ